MLAERVETVACDAEAHTIVGHDPAVLRSIISPEIALAVWERPSGEIDRRLSGLTLDAVDDVAATVVPGDASHSLCASLADAGYPGDLATTLAHDIAALASRFAALARCDRVALRLEVVETDACRRFHADYVTYRLLCTYRGRGTEWRGREEDAAVRQLPTGAVAVFKGRLLMEEPAVLHRSPPVAAAGEQRLLLVLDPASTWVGA